MDCGHPGREYQGGAIAPPRRGDVKPKNRAGLSTSIFCNVAASRNDHRSILPLIAAIVLPSHLRTSPMDCRMRRCYVGLHT